MSPWTSFSPKRRSTDKKTANGDGRPGGPWEPDGWYPARRRGGLCGAWGDLSHGHDDLSSASRGCARRRGGSQRRARPPQQRIEGLREAIRGSMGGGWMVSGTVGDGLCAVHGGISATRAATSGDARGHLSDARGHLSSGSRDCGRRSGGLGEADGWYLARWRWGLCGAWGDLSHGRDDLSDARGDLGRRARPPQRRAWRHQTSLTLDSRPRGCVRSASTPEVVTSMHVVRLAASTGSPVCSPDRISTLHVPELWAAVLPRVRWHQRSPALSQVRLHVPANTTPCTSHSLAAPGELINAPTSSLLCIMMSGARLGRSHRTTESVDVRRSGPRTVPVRAPSSFLYHIFSSNSHR